MIRTFRILFFVGLMMPLSCIATPIVEVSGYFRPDIKTDIEAYLKQARHNMKKGDYVTAKKKLEKVLELDEEHEEALILLAECEEKIMQQKVVEETAFDAAINDGNVQALRAFIEQYPNSEFVNQAENCIADFEMWTVAKQKNSKSAYQEYLSNSTVLGYKKEAEEFIHIIEAEEAWLCCHNSNSIEKLESFVNQYSGTSHSDEAQFELNLIRAEKYYQQNENDFALVYYKKANGFRALTGDCLKRYNELLQEEQYNKLKNSYVLDDLMVFLKHLSTDSPYYNSVSNKIAIIKANNLTSYSSEMDMDIALNYAKDDLTKEQVKQRISDVKKQQRLNERNRKKRRRQAWWEDRVTLGWNMIGGDVDPSLNLDMETAEDFPTTCSLETGLRLRFGRFDDIFNFTIGVDYQNYWGKYISYGYYFQEARYQTVHRRLAFPINVKLNINGGNSSSSLFMACSAEFGYEINEFVDHFKCFINGGNNNVSLTSSIAIEPQIGFNYKHFDWGLYYRCYLNGYGFFEDVFSAGNKRFGIYMTVYF